MRQIRQHISRLRQRVEGFTLIETLIAVLLLATALAGPLTIAAKGLSAALIARDQMVAFYLAQEGVEYVRFVRDSNKLSGDPWLTNLSACTGADGCTIEPSSADVDACSGTCPVLNRYENGNQVLFTYGLGNATPQQFVRTIKLSTPPTGEISEVVLSVTVTWRAQSGLTRTVVVRENLTDWQ